MAAAWSREAGLSYTSACAHALILRIQKHVAAFAKCFK